MKRLYNNKRLFRVYQITIFIIYLFLLGFYVFHSLQNGEDSTNKSNFISNIVAGFIEFITRRPVIQDDSFKHLVRKLIGHYGFYVMIGTFSILFYLTITKLKSYYRVIIHFVSGFLFSLFTEFGIQLFTDGRHAAMKDVMINYLGFITISSIITIVYYIIQYRNKKHDQL